MFKRDVIGNVVQNLRAGSDVAGERTIRQCAVTQTGGAVLVIAGQAVHTPAADLRTRFAREPVTSLTASRVWSPMRYDPAKFMSQHSRQLDLRAMILMPHGQVAATNACPLDFEDELIRA